MNVKDSFTRMKQERDNEKSEAQATAQVERAAALARKKKIGELRDQLFALFAMDDKPQLRGKQLELVLNGLFRAYGVLVHEDFKRRDPDSSTVLEQIDGVIVLDGIIHLVEMKWLKDPVGIADFSPHCATQPEGTAVLPRPQLATSFGAKRVDRFHSAGASRFLVANKGTSFAGSERSCIPLLQVP